MYNKRTVKEKKELRSISNKIGITYCLTIITYILIWAFIPSQQSTYHLHMLIQMACSLLYFFVLIKTCPIESRYVILFKKPKKYTGAYILIGFPLCLLAGIVSSTISEALKNTHIYSVQPSILNEPDFLFFSVIGAPIVEEFVFRGAILGFLRKYGDKFAIFVSAIFFGLIHANMEQFVYAFLIGLYFGFIVIKTQSIITSVLLHTFINAFSSIGIILKLLFIFKNNNSIIFYISVLFQALIILLAIIAFIKCKKNDATFFSFTSLSQGKTILKLREKYSAFLFNPGILLMLTYIVYSFMSLGWIEN